MQFTTTIRKFPEGLWSYHIMIPDEIVTAMTRDGKKRVMCKINDYPPFHAGLQPDGNGNRFVMLNKQKMKSFKLNIGEEVVVDISKDKSKYGMEMPKEFAEVLATDPEGEAYFEALTDGKKRSLIYAVASVKNTDTRITKALIILDHLTANNGLLDNKALYEAFKLKNRRF